MTSKEALEIIVRKHCVSNTDKEDKELEKCYMRLTKAVSGRGGKYLVDLLDIQVVADKLGLLEDIEEDLGVDLIKLLRARTIFTIDKVYGIFYHIDIENGGVYTREYDADDEFYPFSDYGKTWAFTREELEKS